MKKIKEVIVLIKKRIIQPNQHAKIEALDPVFKIIAVIFEVIAGVFEVIAAL